MRAAAQTTLTASALVVGIAAVGLTRAIFHLRAIHANLTATADAADAVADLTSTVPDRLTSVNASLKPVRDFCDTL
jgi:multidrug resistance efflux pump